MKAIPVVVGSAEGVASTKGEGGDARAAGAVAKTFAVDGRAPEDLEEELVCVQWRACDPMTPIGGAGAAVPLRTQVEAFMLLNKSVHFSKFSGNREINNVKPVSATEVSACTLYPISSLSLPPLITQHSSRSNEQFLLLREHQLKLCLSCVLLRLQINCPGANITEACSGVPIGAQPLARRSIRRR